jgi:His-Xaa-Ser system radical SAM maturase HxsC
MFIEDDKVTFYPDELCVFIAENEQEKVSSLEDNDIIEIHDNGMIYRPFAHAEGDSAVFLGAKCNSNCIMCPAGDGERIKGVAYSSEQLTKYISYLPDYLNVLVVTGGEPTLYHDNFLLVLRLLKKKYFYTKILLLTNGRTLSNSTFLNEVCEAAPNNFVFAIPIHGATEQLHDSITRVPGSLYQTSMAINKLLSRKMPVEIRVVVSKMNSDHLTEIANLIATNYRTAKCVHFIGLEPRGNCVKNKEQVYITHSEAFAKMKLAVNLLMEAGIDTEIYNFPLCAVDRGYWSICRRSIAEYKAIYHDKCAECDVKPLCGALFSVAVQNIAPEINPIKLERRVTGA